MVQYHIRVHSLGGQSSPQSASRNNTGSKNTAGGHGGVASFLSSRVHVGVNEGHVATSVTLKFTFEFGSTVYFNNHVNHCKLNTPSLPLAAHVLFITDIVMPWLVPIDMCGYHGSLSTNPQNR